MEKQLVSVIIPIYNTEKYLRKCVNSVINQTYGFLQIVLVNDGSLDNSLKICEEYAEFDSRVVVINKTNGGLSSARNAGLEACSGDFVMFLDSDDYLELDAVEILVATFARNDSDIVVMKMRSVSSNYNHMEPSKGAKACERINSDDYLIGLFQREKSCSVCDKMFRSNLWEKRRFRNDILNEDFLAFCDLLINESCTIVEVDYYGYNYYTRQGSISRDGFGKSLHDAVINADSVVKTLKAKNNDRLIPYGAAYALYQARTSIAVMNKVDFKENESFVEYCCKVMREYKAFISNSFMNKKDQLFCTLFPYAPKTFYAVYCLFLKKND